uniref:Uncharacterized protein n=2 Tax=Rhizochromulina marina TaxID=1034831 RepID=A0A7S2SSG6_9STRA|mmetsp:Transcript_4271/g.12679  ORF Transcript_4271/g.12679 Transcript_4271/m.12679 type:complete len:223 (+) Transcript_4271:313-981(+)
MMSRVADVDCESDDGNRPLHLACRHGFAGIAEDLLEAGAAPNAVNANSETPLHMAARHNQPLPVRVLVRAGGDVDARRGYDQATPLCVCCLFNSETAAKALVRWGADLTPPALVQPSAQALSWGYHSLAAYLREVQEAGSFGAWLREPRLKLVKFRALLHSGRAELRPRHLFAHRSFSFLSGLDFDAPSTGYAGLLQFVFGSTTESYASENIFQLILSFWSP